MRTVVWQVILLLLMWKNDVAGYSAVAVVDERRVASSTIELPRCDAAESQKSAQVPVATLYCACVVGRSREADTGQKCFFIGNVVRNREAIEVKKIRFRPPEKRKRKRKEKEKDKRKTKKKEQKKEKKEKRKKKKEKKEKKRKKGEEKEKRPQKRCHRDGSKKKKWKEMFLEIVKPSRPKNIRF